MRNSPDSLQSRLLLLKKSLRRAGVKLTHQRLEIFRAVAGSIEHPDVETVFRDARERMPSVSLDTVYRTLWLFRDLGLIQPLTPLHDRARFDANLAPHHHFICTRCGKTRDFMSEELNGLSVPGAVQDLGRIESTRVEVRGLCLKCAQRKTALTASSRKAASR